MIKMKSKVFIDEHIFLHLLLGETNDTNVNVKNILKEGANDELEIYTSTAVILDLDRILKTKYSVEKRDRTSIIETIINDMTFIEFENHGLLIEALLLCKHNDLSLADAYNLIFAKSKGCERIYSTNPNMTNQYIEICDTQKLKD